MQQEEVEDDFWDTEIEIRGPNHDLRDIFRADYLKARDLSARQVRLTRWHDFATRKIIRELQKHGFPQIGKIYVRRRLIIHGLKLFEEDNQTMIEIGHEREEALMQEYDPRKYEWFSNVVTLCTHNTNQRRTQIYLEDNDFERISQYAEICRLEFDTLVRLCISYTIARSLRYLFSNRNLKESEDDIGELKDFFQNYDVIKNFGVKQGVMLDAANSKEGTSGNVREYKTMLENMPKLTKSLCSLLTHKRLSRSILENQLLQLKYIKGKGCANEFIKYALENGIIEKEREGKTIYYRLSPENRNK